jgi:hypothetical protein
LNSEDVHLIVGGHPLPIDTEEVPLKEKSIVHVINLRDVNLDIIEVNIRPLYGRSAPINI